MHYNNPFRTGSMTHTGFEIIVGNLKVLEEQGGTAMRKHCMAELMTAYKLPASKIGSAGAAYTTAKREAVAQGIVPEYGRGGKSVPVIVRKVDVAKQGDLKKVLHKNVTEFEAMALCEKDSGLVIVQHEVARLEAEAEAKAKAEAKEKKAEAKTEKKAEAKTEKKTSKK